MSPPRLNRTDRRTFIAFASIALPVSVRGLLADHHVISADPLTVDFDICSLRGRYTPVEDFYVRNHGEVPSNIAAAFLRIEGEVERPQEITPNQLASLEKRKLGAVLECAGNPVATVGKVSNGIWEGWSFGEVLSLARPANAGAYVNLFGRDGYARSIPISRACADGMVVTHLNGQPLSRHHGAPWRALFPGWYGMDAVKWLERIVVSKTALPANQAAYLELTQGPTGEYESRPLPRVQVKSLILSPENGAVLRHGRLQTVGIAWSGQGQIAKVDVSPDGGAEWRPAIIDRTAPYEWVWWHCELDVKRLGAVALAGRATDEQGSTRRAKRGARRVDGYGNSWYHRVGCVIV